MLKILNNLFQALKTDNLIFCNWKGNGRIEKSLSGEGDLDLFVPLNLKTKFEEIAKNEGFKKVNSYQADHPFLEHYYGFDKESSKFAHLHVYFKIVTGEHISKNYTLPLENYLINNIDHSTILPELNSNAKINIFLVRYYLKIGSLFGLLQYFKEIRKYKDEFLLLDFSQKTSSILELGFSEEIVDEMKITFMSSSFLKRFFLALNIKSQLKKFRRRSFFSHQFYNFQMLNLRLINKLFLKKNKLLNQGFVCAICGLDGSGKSSLVSALDHLFSKNISVKVFHLGKPSSSLMSFAFNPFFKIYSALRRGASKNFNNKIIINSKNVSFIFIFRSLLLAYDRKIETSKAKYYSKKGYLVICDRYPGLEEGKMDSPRIPLNNKRGSFYQFCYKYEKNLYESMQPADVIFKLEVPLEVSLERNNKRNKIGKETEEELINRFSVNSDALFLSKKSYFIDATSPFKHVLLRISESIWNFN